uniref:Uncharacterized protein n=1 Tax=Anguilla anguilla TaxID=7936 RepID=A0A0E9V395_ANGAN
MNQYPDNKNITDILAFLSLSICSVTF